MSRTGWNNPNRKPAAFRPIICLGADGLEYSGLCYSTHQNCIIEPITNQDAATKIGPIMGWKYQEEIDQ